MKSSCPDEATWVLFLDGEVPGGRRKRLQRHLGACPRCRGLVDRLGRVAGILDAAGPRGRRSCPSRDALADFGLGRLREPWGMGLVAHLETCPVCREEMADFEALGEGKEADSIFVALWDGALHGVGFGRFEALRVAAPVVRGKGGRPGVRAFALKWGEGRVEVRVTPGQSRGRVDLAVTLEPPPSETHTVRVEISHCDRIMEARSLGKDGTLVFDGLPAGALGCRLRDLVTRKTVAFEVHLVTEVSSSGA